ncbi:MAG: alpha-ribazole phosphatase [Tannerella sp.]|jgi:alpha-ribazole phosphatase|nr:alpha-ribazole phosphatase [Tannerella sp.]
MDIYLIRHTSVNVSEGICYGQTDVPLKDTFEKEAMLVKQNLRDISFDAIYTSPLSRCTKLADYCGYPEAVRDERLKEISFGAWEMMSYSRIMGYDPRLREWLDDFLNVPATDGESVADLNVRVASFLDELRRKDYRRVCIFAHGGVLAGAKVYAGLIRPEEAFKSPEPFGGIVRISL